LPTWTLPQTEERSKAHLGDKFDWVEPLDAVIFAENDVVEVFEALYTSTDISSNVLTSEEVVVEELARTMQSIEIEAELQKLIDDLKVFWRSLFG